MGLGDWFRRRAQDSIATSIPNSAGCTALHAGSHSFSLSRRTFSLVYTSSNPPNPDDFRTGTTITLNVTTGVTSTENHRPTVERSTIFTTLPVRAPRDPSLVEKPPYWPTYVHLSEEQRWMYLTWLQDPAAAVDLGYVFLYFYGLERRLLTSEFDPAFQEAMLLREHHGQGSFPEFAERSVLAGCTIRNRPDCAREYLVRFPCVRLNNLALLVMSRLGMGLTPEQLMGSASLFKGDSKGIKRTYMSSHPTLYRACLEEILSERFERTDMPFADVLDIVEGSTSEQGLFANISIQSLVPSVGILNTVQCQPFLDRIASVLTETHETVKKHLKSARTDSDDHPVPVEPLLDTPTTTCPACGTHFARTPVSRRPCPSCGAVLRLRTDPDTHVRSLMTEAQVMACDARLKERRLRSFVENAASYLDTKYADVHTAREELSRKRESAALYSEVLLPLYTAKMREHARGMSWGLWRNDHYAVSELYKVEEQHTEELEELLTVCYIDANGPNNTDSSMVSLYPPFTPFQFLPIFALALLDRIRQLLSQLQLDEDTERSLFLKNAARVRNKYMPISPETAWTMFVEAQESGSSPEDRASPSR